MIGRRISSIFGSVLCIEAACMLPSLMVALVYNEGREAISFAVSALVIAMIGFIMTRFRTDKTVLYARDGYAIVGISWLAVSVFGALPYLLSGTIPTVIDAFFESTSGFSTTGSTILTDVEVLPQSILFWRSFTHWMGGMGVLVLIIALLPSKKGSSLHIMKAEVPGPAPDKVVPRSGQSAKILYLAYLILTVALILFYLIGGMSLYDAIVHALSAASSGGFSSKNASIAFYSSPFIEAVTAVFMLMFGVNFTLYYMIYRGKLKTVLADEELRTYVSIAFIAVVLITLNLYLNVYDSVFVSLRYAGFQVSSIITTTSYSTADYSTWPLFSQIILIVLMIVGGSAGSTAGGLKIIRVLVLFKIVKREINRAIHPRAVQMIKVNGRAVDEQVISGVMIYSVFLLILFLVSTLLISLDEHDLITSISAVAATIGNVGAGLGDVGPTGNFSEFSVMSKIVLSVNMIVGRLEIYPIVLLLFPSFWKRVNI